MTAPRAPVTSCIIEPDPLHNLTAFYDEKTKVLCLWKNAYNKDIKMTYKPKSYICYESLVIESQYYNDI